MGQVTIADVLTILAIPLVLRPDDLRGAALGGALVAAGAGAVLLVAHRVESRRWAHRLRKRSERRHWALDLRVSLLVLFSLAWVAHESGTSVLVAGFATGLLVASLRAPKRLFTELRGLADGFFVPVFFVLLGDGWTSRRSSRTARSSASPCRCSRSTSSCTSSSPPSPASRRPRAWWRPPSSACPPPWVTLGTDERVLSGAQGAAIIVAAIASLAAATLGTARLATRSSDPATPVVTPV